MSQVPANMAVARRPPIKNLQVARTSTNSSSHPTGSISKTAPMVEVVHIPAHGNSPDDLQIIKLSTIEIDHKNAPNTYTAKIEQRLKDVPNIRDYECLFKWDSRSLVDANIKGTGIPKGWGGMYLVYKCVESVAGLPVNEHFEPVNTVRPYGDVFVFRLKEPGYVKSGMTEYGTMEKDFLQNYAHNGVARAILAALAACKPE